MPMGVLNSVCEIFAFSSVTKNCKSVSDTHVNVIPLFSHNSFLMVMFNFLTHLMSIPAKGERCTSSVSWAVPPKKASRSTFVSDWCQWMEYTTDWNSASTKSRIAEQQHSRMESDKCRLNCRWITLLSAHKWRLYSNAAEFSVDCKTHESWPYS